MQFEDALSLHRNSDMPRDLMAHIEGHDACRKICIIASLVFRKARLSRQCDYKGI